jgi:cytochrome c553
MNKLVGKHVVIATLAALAAFAVSAQAADVVGNAKAGRSKVAMCIGCHGIPGYRTAFPEVYRVPILGGQNQQYLENALHAYKKGDRHFDTMHAITASLSDQDIADIADYFAGTPLKPTGKTAADMPKAAALCTSCHGTDGVAVAVIYPSLAGQHEDYLERALDEYQKGGRKNLVMKTLAANLKRDDIDAIAEYFAGLTPALHTEERPYTRFTAQ